MTEKLRREEGRCWQKEQGRWRGDEWGKENKLWFPYSCAGELGADTSIPSRDRPAAAGALLNITWACVCVCEHTLHTHRCVEMNRPTDADVHRHTAEDKMGLVGQNKTSTRSRLWVGGRQTVSGQIFTGSTNFSLRWPAEFSFIIHEQWMSW